MSYKTNITPSESQQNRVKIRQNTVNTEVWDVLPDFYILTKNGRLWCIWAKLFYHCFTWWYRWVKRKTLNYDNYINYF